VSKSVKMVAVIGDEEVVVGRCHPGQARILRQAGMADWKKNRLLLKSAPGADAVQDIEKILGLDSNLERQKMLKDQALKKVLGENLDESWTPDRWRQAGPFGKADDLSSKWTESLKDILGNADAEEVIDVFSGAARRQLGPTHRCDTLLAWGMRCLELRAAGHDLYAYDDPRRLALGFVDASDGNTCYEFSVRRLRSTPDSVFETLGTTRKQLASIEGRLEFIRGGKVPEFEEPTDEECEQLQDIFHRGVGHRLRKFQDKEYLDEIMPSTAETVRAALGLKSRADQLIAWTHVVQEQLGKRTVSQEVFLQDFFQECRRSGHTTEMLLEAVAFALQGRPVLIRAHAYTQSVAVVRRGLEMIRQVNPAWEGFFEEWRPEKAGMKPGGMAPRVFWDKQHTGASGDPLNSHAGLRFRATRSNPSEAIRDFRSYLAGLRGPNYTSVPSSGNPDLTLEEVQEVFVQGPNEDDHYLRMCHALVHLSQGGVVWFFSLGSHQLRLLYPLRKQAIRMGLPLEIYGGESAPDKDLSKIRVWRTEEPAEGILFLDHPFEE